MGNLSVLAIRHDCLNEIRENPEEFVEKLVSMLSSGSARQGGSNEISCGRHGNVAVVMPYCHASDSQAYILAGNTIAPIDYDMMQDEKHWAVPHVRAALTRAGIRVPGDKE